MKSASYKLHWCPDCGRGWMLLNTPRAPLTPSRDVSRWVLDKVRPSAYIISLSRRCKGCAEVHTYICEVLGNLLHKLEIKV